MLGLIASLVASTLLTAGGYTYSELTAKAGGNIKKDYQKVINEIAKYLSTNQGLLNELTAAYQDHNSNLFNKLVMANPMGPGYDHLVKQIQINKENYQEQSRKLNDKITEANTDLANAQQRAAEAGSSIAGNNAARQHLSELSAKYGDTQSLQQNVNGGLHEK